MLKSVLALGAAAMLAPVRAQECADPLSQDTMIQVRTPRTRAARSGSV